MTNDSLIQLIEAERYDASGNPHYERFNDGLNYAIAIIREHIAAPDVMKVGKAIDECIKYGDCSTENLGKAAIAAMGAVGAAPASLTAEELPLDRGVSPASANSSEISDAKLVLVECDCHLLGTRCHKAEISGDKTCLIFKRTPKPVSVAQCVAAYSMSVPENDRPQNIYEQGIEAVLNAAGVAYGK